MQTNGHGAINKTELQYNNVMNNIFSTTTLQFKKRTTFNIAVEILQKLEQEMGENLLDVGHSDMVISIFSEIGLTWCLGELSVHQIWDKPSKLKGDADFSIIEKDGTSI